MGSFEVRSPSHLPTTLLKSVTAVGCHWRVSLGAMELQATMRFTAMIRVNILKFLLSFVISFSNSSPIVRTYQIHLFVVTAFLLAPWLQAPFASSNALDLPRASTTLIWHLSGFTWQCGQRSFCTYSRILSAVFNVRSKALRQLWHLNLHVVHRRIITTGRSPQWLFGARDNTIPLLQK